MGWYETSYRKLFFDFHSSETASGLAEAFDAAQWAEWLERAHAQAVSVFMKCGFGWSFYRKGSIRYVHPRLPEGLDMVQAQIEALHERGIRAIGYYHTFNSEPVARDFPQWRCLDENGNPRGISICMQGPALERWMLAHIEELVAEYELDAMFFDGLYAYQVCYCGECRRRFREETGRELPLGDRDSSWPSYVEWALADFRRIRERVSEAVHKHRPDLPVSFNWVYSMRQPERIPDHTGSLMIDIFPDNQPFNGSYQSKMWAVSGRPFDIMNSAFLQWWGDWNCKPAVAMQHEVATVIANGGLTWIGYQMTHRFEVQDAVMKELGKTLEFVRRREPLLVGAKPKAYVAVLHSTDSYFLPDRPALFANQSTMRGLHKMLMESALPHHFLNEEQLLKHLCEVPEGERYFLVIVAEQHIVEGELTGALERFVREGGGLLVTGRSGLAGSACFGTNADASGARTYDKMAGVDRLGELLGIEWTDERPIGPHSYIEVTDPELVGAGLGMPHLCEVEAIPVRLRAAERLAEIRACYAREDGQPLLSRSPSGPRTGHPAITFRKFGAGAVSYVALDVFRAYHTRNVWPLKHAIANLIRRRLCPDFPLQLDSPAWLEVTVAEQTVSGNLTDNDMNGSDPTNIDGIKRTIIHLTNHHGNGPVDQNNVCIENSLPVRDITLTLRFLGEPAGVRLEPGHIEPDWSYEDGRIIVTVPEVIIHSAVVVLH